MKWTIAFSFVLPMIMAGCSDHPSKIGVQKEQAVVAAAGAAAKPDRSGQEAYLAVCKRCHGETGLGQAGLYPPLADSPWVQGDPEIIARIVTNGLQGKIEVNGVTYDEKMTPQRAILRSDAEFAALINYVRTAFGKVEGAAPITADQVAAITPKGSMESAAELQALLEAGDGSGSDEGGTDEGGTDEGGTDEGGSDEGGSDEGGSDEGGTDEGGTDEGGSDEGGSDGD